MVLCVEGLELRRADEEPVILIMVCGFVHNFKVSWNFCGENHPLISKLLHRVVWQRVFPETELFLIAVSPYAKICDNPLKIS